MKSRKMVLMNLSAGQQWRCRHREQTCGHSGGRVGASWESDIEIYTLPFGKQKASGNWLYDAGSANLLLCDNLEVLGWGGRWEGGSGGAGHLCSYGRFMLTYGRNQHNTVKQLTSNENKLIKKISPCYVFGSKQNKKQRQQWRGRGRRKRQISEWI